MSRINARECILSFTKLLRVGGFSSFAPEEFRLAKFNDPRSRLAMRKLLYELVYMVLFKSIDPICSEGFIRFTESDVDLFLYNQLERLTYPLLPRDASNHHFSSRELLLASVWIFSNQNILQMIGKIFFREFNCITKVETPSSLDDQTLHESRDMSVKHLIWATGQLRMQMKQAGQSRLGILNRSINSINNDSSSHGVNPLASVSLTKACPNKLLLARLEKVNEHLKVLIDWSDVSHVFWKWIKSVFSTHTSQETPELVDASPAVLSNLTEIREEFNESVASHAQFLSKIGVELDVVNPTECKLDVLLSRIDKEVKSLDSKLMCDLPGLFETLLLPLQYNYHILTPCSKKKSKEITRNTSSLSTECRNLSSLINTVKRQNEREKDDLGRQLRDFATKTIPEMRALNNTSETGIDRERLALAVLLARRDVARMVHSGTSDSNVTPIAKPAIVSSPVSNVNLTSKPTRTQSNPPHFVRKATVGKRREEYSRPRRDDLPARGDSPPCREYSDNTTLDISRNRPLHEPTERRLQSAKDSQMRQLQAKIARYSEAIADLRINPQSDDLTNAISVVPTHAPRPKSSVKPVSSTKPTLPHPAKSKSVLHYKPVPLRLKPSISHRPQSARQFPNPSRCRTIASARSTGTNGSMSNRTTQSVASTQSSKASLALEQERVQSKVDALWDQTVRLLLHDQDSEQDVVILKPDQNAFRSNRLAMGASRSIEQQSVPSGDSARGGSSFFASASPSYDVFPLKNQSASDVCQRSGNDELPNQARRLLNQLDEADAQEDSIRLRWADLSLADAPKTAPNGSKSTMVRFQPFHRGKSLKSNISRDNPVHRVNSEKPWRPREMVSSQANRRPDQGITFEKARKVAPSNSESTSDSQIHHQPSPPILPPTEIAPTPFLQLRLPTSLHRQLLLQSARHLEASEQLRKRHHILTSPECQTLPIAAVCESFVDDVIEELLDHVVRDIERETSNLINDVVLGELCTEAPESSLIFSNTSDFEFTPIHTPVFREEEDSVTTFKNSANFYQTPMLSPSNARDVTISRQSASDRQISSRPSTITDQTSVAADIINIATTAEDTEYSSGFEKCSSHHESSDEEDKNNFPLEINSLLDVHDIDSPSSATLIANSMMRHSRGAETSDEECNNQKVA